MITEPRSAPPPRLRVLFIGDDSSSPQIAASLLRRETGDLVDIATAGTQPTDPGGRSDEMLVAMGLDPADEQLLSTRALHGADRVVVLGADLDVARLSGPRYEEWDLARGDLIDRVHTLGSELTTGPEPRARRGLLARLRSSLASVRSS